MSSVNFLKEFMFMGLLKQGRLFVDCDRGAVKVVKGFGNMRRVICSSEDNRYIPVYYTFSDFQRNISLHRLVWMSVYGLIEDGKFINHIDGIKGHCWLSNLELTDYSGNLQHAYDTGLRRRNKGEQIYNASLSDSEVLDIRSKFKSKELSLDDICAIYPDMPVTTIKGILIGRTYSHLDSFGITSIQDNDRNYQLRQKEADDRNSEILKLYESGLTYGEIAERMNCTYHSVRWSLKRRFEKKDRTRKS